MLCHIKMYPLFFKTVTHHFQPVCRSNINTCHRSGIHNDNLCILFYAVLNILLKSLYIGKEKTLTKTVDHHMLNFMGITVLTAVIKALSSRNNTQKSPWGIRRFQDHCDKGKNNSYDHSINRSQ